MEPSLGDSDIPGDDLKEFLANLISKPGDIRELLVDLISSPGKQEIRGQEIRGQEQESESDVVTPTLSDDSFETPRESRTKLFPLLRRSKFQPKLKTIDDSENEIRNDLGGEDDMMAVKLRQLSPEINNSDDEMMKTVLKAIMTEEKEETSSSSSGRRRRLRRPNLFSTEERRKSSIFNR